MQAVCSKCIFFESGNVLPAPDQSVEPDEVPAIRYLGQCRRHAPHAGAVPPYWPAMQDDQWCGEFVDNASCTSLRDRGRSA